MTYDIARWLTGIGLPQYAEVFQIHDINLALLAQLTADELREIGVPSLGHRKKILAAIAASTPTQSVAMATPLRPEPARDYTPRHLRERILQSRAALEGERKQVSVLFADVQGSMALAAQLDPEQWHQILEGYFAILGDGVHRFEGTVNQYTGDGIMALFGAPIAHEDHAQRACFAALHLQREIARYATEVKRQHGVGFSTRIGINSGEVVVGKIGDDLRMDYTAQGPTVGLAQRMESLAEPNTCYLGAATAALVQGYFALEDLGEFRVKGVAEPVQVHRLAGRGEAHTRFDVSRQRGLSRFVGRAADLLVLEAALAEVAAGHGQAVGVVAEAGTGKSRLCFEFLELCRARGMQVFEGRAVAHGRHIPLLPILELMRALLGILAHDDARSAREKIAGRMVLLDPGLTTELPLLFDFLGVSDARQPQPDRDPQARQRALFVLLHQLVRCECERAPVVLMLEDLHWLDDTSQECVAQLVQACPERRCLLLLNFRPEYQVVWGDRAWYRQVDLQPLGPQAIAELVHGLLGRHASIAALAQDIHARTGGNPFFAEEVTQSLVEAGQLAGERGAYRLATPVARLSVPATVQAVLAARIDRLAERDKQVLQLAAVIGKEFALPVLDAIAALGAQELADALEALQRGGFLHALLLYPVAEYTFRHPLTQEVALQGQLRERRRHTHAAVARVIEQQDGQRLDERAALLAHHWEEAGEALVAARWHRRAAESPACPGFGWAMHHWERVRSLLRGLAQEPESLALRLAACTRLLTLGQRVGVDAQVSRELLDEGQALADAAGDPRARIRLSLAYGWTQMSTGDTATCLDLLASIQPELRTINDPLLQATAWGNLVLLNSFAARFAGALDLVAQCQALLGADTPNGQGLGSLNARASLAQFRAYCLAWTGHLTEALDGFGDSLRLADPVGELAVFARCHCAEVHYLRREPLPALERAQQAAQICRTLGEPAMLQARVQVAFAFAHLAAGRSADAVVAARAAMAVHRSVDRVHAGLSAWLLAEALLQAGALAQARDAAIEAIGLCQRSLRANYEIAAQGVLARAALRLRGNAACAEAHAALDAAQSLIARTDACTLAPALLEWRAELTAACGDAALRAGPPLV